MFAPKPLDVWSSAAGCNSGCRASQDEARRELLAMSDAQLEDVARVCNRYPDIQLTYELAGGNSATSGDAVSLQVDLQREQAGEIRPVDAPRYATSTSLSICVNRVHSPEPSGKGVSDGRDQLVPEASSSLDACLYSAESSTLHLEESTPGRRDTGSSMSGDACRYPARKEEQWWLVVGDPKANSLLAIKRVSLQRKSKVKLDFAAPSETGSHHLVLYFMCDSYLGADQVSNLITAARPSVLCPELLI